jgi:hypothetical protein
MLASTSSSTRCIAISRSTNSPSAVEFIDVIHVIGLGFERTIAYVTGLSNVRDAIPFPKRPEMPDIDAQDLRNRGKRWRSSWLLSALSGE